jgi:hypothetical protein
MPTNDQHQQLEEDFQRKLLTEQFGCQAEWRRMKATEYPDDPRNLEAAALLDHMAATVKDIPDEIIDAYCKAFEYDETAIESWLERLRVVGFRSFPDNAREFVQDFIDEVDDHAVMKAVTEHESDLLAEKQEHEAKGGRLQ